MSERRRIFLCAATATLIGSLAASAHATDALCEVAAAPDRLSRVLNLTKSANPASCSVRALISKLERSSRLRGEFETTAEYDARRSAEAASSDIAAGAPLAIVFPIRPDNTYYNADTKVFWVMPSFLARRARVVSSLVAFTDMSVGLPERGVMLHAGKEISNSRFSAQNAFGAQISAIREEGQTWEVFLRFDGSATTSPESAWTTLPVSRADAQVVKHALAFVLVGTAGTPAVIDRKDYRSATFDNPIERSVTQHALRFIASYGLVVRIDTGQVLMRTEYEMNGSEVVLPVGVNSTPQLPTAGVSQNTATPMQKEIRPQGKR